MLIRIINYTYTHNSNIVQPPLDDASPQLAFFTQGLALCLTVCHISWHRCKNEDTRERSAQASDASALEVPNRLATLFPAAPERGDRGRNGYRWVNFTTRPNHTDHASRSDVNRCWARCGFRGAAIDERGWRLLLRLFWQSCCFFFASFFDAISDRFLVDFASQLGT